MSRPRLTSAQLDDLRKRVLQAVTEGRDVRGLGTLLERAHIEKDFEDPTGALDGEESLDLFSGDRYDEAVRRLSAAPRIAGFRRATGTVVADIDEGSRPSVAVSDDRRILVTWVEWHSPEGEVIRASHDGVVATISGTPGDCFRPTCLFDASGVPWVFYAKAVDGRVGVWASHHEEGPTGSEGSWTGPEPVSGDRHPAFNQEAIALPDGTLVCCWQTAVDGRFTIVSSANSGGEWSAPAIISNPAVSAWDPAIAALPQGRVAYAWSEYGGGSFRVCIRFERSGRLGDSRPITAGSDYAVHPSLAPARDGGVWCAFDLMAVQGHGGSGPTQLRHRSELSTAFRKSGVPLGWEHFERPDGSAEMRVVHVSESGISTTADGLAPGLTVRPCGLPRIATTAAGGLILAYRVMQAIPLEDRHWEVAVQTLGPEGWSGPTVFDESRAGPEEVGIAVAGEEAVLVWQNDRQRGTGSALHETDPWRPKYVADYWGIQDHLGDLTPATVGSGSISIGRVRGGDAIDPGRSVPIVDSGARTEARRWFGTPTRRHTVDRPEGSYTLYWGDFHRHSLISRCLSGEEPTLEDYDRFSRDVCEFDFWALTDHAEHTSPYQWWTIKKRADLLRVEGAFVPFYGFEWTSGYGHQNVIYDEGDRGAPIFSSEAEATRRPDQLWTALRASGYRAVTIPHHPGSRKMSVDWSFDDPELLRLAEVFQACRGNYEAKDAFRRWGDALAEGAFIVDALNLGRRFGLVASSDHGYGAGYVGVYARALDRASLFEAIHARRTIAATTRGIAVDFRAAGAFMGEERSHLGPVELRASANAYAEIARLDLIRNGEVFETLAGRPVLERGEISVPIHLEWDETVGTMDWSGWLRLLEGRVLDTEFWSPVITEVTPSGIGWRARTARGHRGGIDVTLIGTPQTVVQVKAGTHTLNASLGALAAGDRPSIRAETGGRLWLSPGFGGLVSLGTNTVSIERTDDPWGNAWYMARVTLADGEMGWSSPIWIDRPIDTQR